MKRLFLGVPLALMVLAGCGASTGTFDDQAGTLTCLRHQSHTPAAEYQGGNTGRTLSVLRYYTANGAKPYCDGKSATATDRRWAELYVRMGADRTHVAPILGAG